MYVTAVCLTLCSLSISAVANGSCLGGLGVSVLCFVSLCLFSLLLLYRFLFLVFLIPARRARCIASASQRLIPSAAAADAAAVTVTVFGGYPARSPRSAGGTERYNAGPGLLLIGHLLGPATDKQAQQGMEG